MADGGKAFGTWPQRGLSPRNLMVRVRVSNPVMKSPVAIAKSKTCDLSKLTISISTVFQLVTQDSHSVHFTHFKYNLHSFCKNFPVNHIIQALHGVGC